MKERERMNDTHPAFHPQAKWMRAKRRIDQAESMWLVTPDPHSRWHYLAFPDYEYDDSRYRVHAMWLPFLFSTSPSTARRILEEAKDV